MWHALKKKKVCEARDALNKWKTCLNENRPAAEKVTSKKLCPPPKSGKVTAATGAMVRKPGPTSATGLRQVKKSRKAKKSCIEAENNNRASRANVSF